MSMEDALNSVKTYFDANLETELDVIRTARGVDIPTCKTIDTSYVKTKQYPNISIVQNTTAFEYGDNDEFLNPWNHHEIAVIISNAGGDQKETQLVCTRYVEAIENISTGTKDHYTYGGLVEVVQLTDVTYGIEVANEEKSLIQATVLSIIVKEVQT